MRSGKIAEMDEPFVSFEVSDDAFESEGLRHVTVASSALGRRASLCVWQASDHEPVATIVLLHGVFGSEWAWALRAGAHRSCARAIVSSAAPPFRLVMPSDGLWGDGSGYLDGPAGNVEAWVLDEAPLAAALAFDPAASPSEVQDQKLFLCGLSMGGYGALRLGAKYAPRVAGVSAHSSVTQLDELSAWCRALPQPRVPGDDDVMRWMRANRQMLPQLRFDCGRDDELVDSNRALHDALDDLGISHRYEEFAGAHEWDYWERHFADSLTFFAEILAR